MTVILWEDCDFKNSVKVCDFRQIPFLKKLFQIIPFGIRITAYKIFVYYKIWLYKLHIINFWCYLSITFIFFFYFWNNLEYMVNTLKDTFLLLPNTCRNYHVSLSHEFCNWKYCKHFSRDNFYLFVEFELKIDKINEVYKFVSKEIFFKGTERIQFSSFSPLLWVNKKNNEDIIQSAITLRQITAKF